jgi:hypothetical protein
MPTENRRVAAYLPKELDDRFKSFIAERGLKGESPALIAILSEFLGVSQEVAHQSSSEFQALSLRMDGIDSSLQENSKLLSELLDRITKIESMSAPVSQPLVSVPVAETIPGQMDLLAEISPVVPISVSSDSLSDSKSELLALKPLNGAQLAKRFCVDRGTPNTKKRELDSLAFRAWSKSKDPDDIEWNYDEASKRFVPISGEDGSDF